MRISLKVNGGTHEVEVASADSLLTVLVNRLDLPPAGAGETPIVGLAPALGNAIFDAIGVRLRSLPLIARGLPGSTSQA